MAAHYATKALLYDQLVGQKTNELVEALEKAFVGMQNWHAKHAKETY